MTPQNISVGFKKAGIWPFNRDAIKQKEKDAGDGCRSGGISGNDEGGGGDESGGGDGEESGGSDDARYGNSDSRDGSGGSGGSRHDGQDMRGNDEDVGDEGDIVSGEHEFTATHSIERGANSNAITAENTNTITFTPEQEEKFQRRHEEGYDIYDPIYINWLELNHPESLPPDRYTLTPYTGSPLPSSSASNNDHLETTTPSNHQSPSTSLHSSCKTSPLSSYLSPVIPTAPRIKTGKARVLTSSECIAILEDKERKKKAEQEEKERRKVERETKKKQKEEEKRQKAEERAKKAEEKAKKADGKARAAAAKAASNTTRNLKRAPKRKNNASEPLAKRARSELEVDANTCAICFGTYEEDLLGGGGEDWIQCTCGKWVHEECVEDCEPDRDGNPRFCPDCIEQYM